MKKRIIAFIMVFIVTGCASSSLKDSFQAENNRLHEKSKAICAMPEFAQIFAKMACSPQDITFEQLADNTKITEEQKPIFLKLVAQSDALSKETIESFRNGDDGAKRWAGYLDSIQSENNELRLALYNGKITWGAYNQRRKSDYAHNVDMWRQFTQ